MRATVGGVMMRTPSSTPPDSSIAPKRARSDAVPKRPAWPATPPIRRAVGSCTVPRSIEAPRPPQGHPSGVQASVGAIRERKVARGLKVVSRMRSGSKIRRAANSSSDIPLTRDTISPSTTKLISL